MKKATGLSLHIGLNAVDPAQYEGWSGPLAACEADAEDMERIASARGFTPTILRTAQATRDSVAGAIKAAAQKLVKGDIFWVSYSGHGGQVPDINGDEPDDLLDETWCLFDGELLDDELYALWAQFKPGVRILMVSDSCHSGSVARLALSTPSTGPARAALADFGVNEELRYRFMPREVALRTYRAHAAFYDSLQPRKARRGKKGAKPAATPSVKAPVRLLSGCQDNQLSLDGTFNGLFTSNLLRVWNDGKFKGNYAAFHKAIVKRMPPTQTPNHFMTGAHDPDFDAQPPFAI
jgi:hypothetical protein